MNYLAHLHLGGPEPQALLGSLYGDFVKGRLAGHWPPTIEAAIKLHRKVDAFTDQHPLLVAAKGRFKKTPRRFSGIVLDVFFDHCLAKNWQHYADVPLGQFTQSVYQVLAATDPLPGKLALIAPKMAAADWLGSYQHFQVLEQVLAGIAKRFIEPEVLDHGFAELAQHYQAFAEDFTQFYPELLRFAQRHRIHDRNLVWHGSNC